MGVCDDHGSSRHPRVMNVWEGWSCCDVDVDRKLIIQAVMEHKYSEGLPEFFHDKELLELLKMGPEYRRNLMGFVDNLGETTLGPLDLDYIPEYSDMSGLDIRGTKVRHLPHTSNLSDTKWDSCFFEDHVHLDGVAKGSGSKFTLCRIPSLIVTGRGASKPSSFSASFEKCEVGRLQLSRTSSSSLILKRSSVSKDLTLEDTRLHSMWVEQAEALNIVMEGSDINELRLHGVRSKLLSLSSSNVHNLVLEGCEIDMIWFNDVSIETLILKNSNIEAGSVTRTDIESIDVSSSCVGADWNGRKLVDVCYERSVL